MFGMTALTPEACRAARALLRWSVRDLGERVGVRGESISAFETGRPMREGNKAKIVLALDAAGVEILNGDSPGARMKAKADG